MTCPVAQPREGRASPLELMTLSICNYAPSNQFCPRTTSKLRREPIETCLLRREPRQDNEISFLSAFFHALECLP
jgi:hypothetical protein